MARTKCSLPSKIARGLAPSLLQPLREPFPLHPRCALPFDSIAMSRILFFERLDRADAARRTAVRPSTIAPAATGHCDDGDDGRHLDRLADCGDVSHAVFHSRNESVHVARAPSIFFPSARLPSSTMDRSRRENLEATDTHPPGHSENIPLVRASQVGPGSSPACL